MLLIFVGIQKKGQIENAKAKTRVSMSLSLGRKTLLVYLKQDVVDELRMGGAV